LKLIYVDGTIRYLCITKEAHMKDGSYRNNSPD